MKHCTITVRNIDSKLFKKQRMALIRVMNYAKQAYGAGKKVQSDLELLEGLLNMTDSMADIIDGVE